MPSTVSIPLTRGYCATIDAEDAVMVCSHKWSVCISTRKDGTIRSAYAVRKITDTKGMQKRILLHRVLLDAPNDMQVDHIDGNGLNNRRENIRLCTGQENSRNQRTRICSSRYKGVSWHKKRRVWQSYIRNGTDGRQVHLVYFKSEIEAATAYDNAAKLSYGQFANLNVLPHHEENVSA